MDLAVEASPDSIFAGAIGAALWGAFRREKLAQIGQLAKASFKKTNAIKILSVLLTFIEQDRRR